MTGNVIATVDPCGLLREVSLLLLPEEAEVGDYVLIHAGFAIQKISEQAANDALGLIDEIVEMLEEREDAS